MCKNINSCNSRSSKFRTTENQISHHAVFSLHWVAKSWQCSPLILKFSNSLQRSYRHPALFANYQASPRQLMAHLYRMEQRLNRCYRQLYQCNHDRRFLWSTQAGCVSPGRENPLQLHFDSLFSIRSPPDWNTLLLSRPSFSTPNAELFQRKVGVLLRQMYSAHLCVFLFSLFSFTAISIHLPSTIPTGN